jgi:hypothetical protein
MRNRLFILLLAAVCLTAAVCPASAEEVVIEFSWKSLKESGELAAGQYIPPGTLPQTPFDCLKISSSSGQSLTAQLLALPDPAITTNLYALTGKVKYQGVAGQGYLEMMNHFPKGRYFTKTLADSGPMQYFKGDSDWRPVVLPFSFRQESGTPEKITLSLVLPQTGTVYLSDLKLMQYKQGENPLAAAMPGVWWNARTAGYIGGISGAFIGILGALIGFLTASGRSQRFVRMALNAILFIGVAALAIGGIALWQAQPYAVFYPLLLLGGICTVLSLVLQKPVKQAYRNREMRKMQSMDM